MPAFLCLISAGVFCVLEFYEACVPLRGGGTPQARLPRVLGYLLVASTLAGLLVSELERPPPEILRGGGTKEPENEPAKVYLTRHKGAVSLKKTKEVLDLLVKPTTYLLMMGGNPLELTLQELHKLVAKLTQDGAPLEKSGTLLLLESKKVFVTLTETRVEQIEEAFPFVWVDGKWQMATEQMLTGEEPSKPPVRKGKNFFRGGGKSGILQGKGVSSEQHDQSCSSEE